MNTRTIPPSRRKRGVSPTVEHRAPHARQDGGRIIGLEVGQVEHVAVLELMRCGSSESAVTVRPPMTRPRTTSAVAAVEEWDCRQCRCPPDDPQRAHVTNLVKLKRNAALTGISRKRLLRRDRLRAGRAIEGERQQDGYENRASSTQWTGRRGHPNAYQLEPVIQAQEHRAPVLLNGRLKVLLGSGIGVVAIEDVIHAQPEPDPGIHR